MHIAGHRLQGGLFTIMVVRIVDPDDPALDDELAEQVARSPSFYANAPVVLDLRECLGCTAASDYVALRARLRRHGLIAVGVQNASALQLRAAAEADLAPFANGAGTGSRRAPERVAASARSRLITEPVRSGMQIYARGGDLIVAAPVSAGAEIIADGHIHVYGVLRGRAIAGAGGDQNARIFVQRLDAELVCIAGRYLVSEAIAPELRRQAVEVALIEDRLRIQPGWGNRGPLQG